MAASTELSRSPRVWRTAGVGQEHQFRPPRLSGRCGIRKRSFAGDYLEHLGFWIMLLVRQASDRGTEIREITEDQEVVLVALDNGESYQIKHVQFIAFVGLTPRPMSRAQKSDHFNAR